jgi:hypothetical protein
MAITPQFLGPPSAIIQEINTPSLFAGTAPLVQGLPGLAYFGPGPQFLPSNVTEIVNMTTNALLAANVEIQGNLQVDGTFSAGIIAAATQATSMAINPGPLTVTGAAPAGLLVYVQNTSSAPSAPTMQLSAQTPGDRIFGINCTGDGFMRFRSDSNGVLQWSTGLVQQDVQLSRSTTGTLTLTAINGGASPSVPGGLIITGGGSVASLLQVINTQSQPGTPDISITGAASADRAFGILVSGDTNHRFRSDTNGLLQWGPGNATQDLNLYRQGVGTLRTDNNFSVGGAILGGTDTNAADIQPTGVQAAGSVGKHADAGHVHQNQAHLSLLTGLTGVTAETVPRGAGNISTNSSTLTSSGQYMRAIGLPANLAILNLTWAIGTTAANGVTHGYYFITDSNRVVKAVTADVTNNTTWNSTTNPVTLALSPGYTTPSAGLYYLGISVTASTTPNIVQTSNLAGGLAGATPILYGLSGSSATPPAIGSTLTTLNAGNGFNAWAMTS